LPQRPIEGAVGVDCVETLQSQAAQHAASAFVQRRAVYERRSAGGTEVFRQKRLRLRKAADADRDAGEFTERLAADAAIVGKNLTITASTLAAHAAVNATATAEASSGITVPFAPASLTFSYGGVTVTGTVPQGGIAIGENVTTRYVLPIGLVLLVLLAAVYYVRKISKPNVPASQR
jgi:hypothetical protein